MKNNNKKIKNAAFLTAIAFSLNSTAYASGIDDLFKMTEILNTNNLYIAEDGNYCGGGCGGQIHDEYLLKHQESNSSDEENIDENPATLEECKSKCKEDFPGKKHKKHRNDCISNCEEPI